VSEDDMAVFIQVILHYLDSHAELPVRRDVINTIRMIKNASPGWPEDVVNEGRGFQREVK
jgi:hypothetical protein